MNIGFVGLGMMGYPMAHRLSDAGHVVTVMDLNPDVTARFVTDHPGATAAVSRDDFIGVEIMITMLPDSNVVEATVWGTDGHDGLAAVLPRDATLIDMSSSEPLRSRRLAQDLAEKGIRFLDAPVSGGVRRAVDGTLAIMVGGEPDVLASCKEVLDAMGKNITHVGAAGTGHAMKALNNYVSAAALVATAEALQLGQAFGLDPQTMVDVMNSSTAKNNTTENKAKQFMLSRTFNSGFSLSLMAKDIGIAMGLGQAIDHPLQLGNEVLQMWRDANEALGKGADHTAMYRHLESTQK